MNIIDNHITNNFEIERKKERAIIVPQNQNDFFCLFVCGVSLPYHSFWFKDGKPYTFYNYQIKEKEQFQEHKQFSQIYFLIIIDLCVKIGAKLLSTNISLMKSFLLYINHNRLCQQS